MSEELYNSHDYCSLAEEYEQARNEIEKLQKILLNFSEYHGSAEKTIEKLNSDVEKWRNTALQLSNNHGQMIDQFITRYNDAVSADKVSVDVKTSTDNNKGE